MTLLSIKRPTAANPPLKGDMAEPLRAMDILAVMEILTHSALVLTSAVPRSNSAAGQLLREIPISTQQKITSTMGDIAKRLMS